MGLFKKRQDDDVAWYRHRNYKGSLSEDQKNTWYRHWVREGLEAFERQLAQVPHSTYCYGDTPSMADCCLVPQIFNGKRFDVAMWVPEQTAVMSSGAPKAAKPKRAAGSGAGGGAGSGQVTVPMQGTIVKVLVEVGQEVESGQAVCVLEAMKMENQILAEKSGKVTEIKVKAGDTVGSGDVVVVIA